ncbi:MAG: alpha/beta fold hydrolase [Myxococcota bacterium]
MLRLSPLVFIPLALLAACSGNQSSRAPQSAEATAATRSDDTAAGTAEGGSTSVDAGGSSGAPATCSGPARVVSFTTSDGVALEADFVPSGQASGKAALLLHMIPPSNDRTNYPPAFIEALTGAGYTVLNVDRRGAGGSQGEAQAAYEGPNGRLDAVAAMAFLASSECALGARDTVIVGASNGTTTALDYAVTAEASSRPRALVFLSPGGYTENQNAVADHADVLSSVPVFLGYPDGERAWPEGVRSLVGDAWQLKQYDGGSHGSRLFTSSPAVTSDIVQFLADHG